MYISFFCLRDGTVDILVLGTSAERRAGSNPAEGIFISNNLKKQLKK